MNRQKCLFHYYSYIEYIHKKNSSGIIGIEVKYTEGHYKLRKGSKEEKFINDKDSQYWYLTNKTGLFKPNKTQGLPKNKYRQVWRNQLLGESILKSSTEITRYTSVLLYPSGNSHFTEVSKEYIEFLVNPTYQIFTAIKFESFFQLIEEIPQAVTLSLKNDT